MSDSTQEEEIKIVLLHRDSILNIAQQVEDFVSLGKRIEDQEYIASLGEIEMPFGKHKGSSLIDIPLYYLDETVSQMPKTWLIRAVIKFVDGFMKRKEWTQEGFGLPASLPNKSANQIIQEWREIFLS